MEVIQLVVICLVLIGTLISMFLLKNLYRRTQKDKDDLIIELARIYDTLKYLKLDNMINHTNEVAKYRNGIYEDEYTLQKVGACKIFKIIEKSTGNVTEVFYDEYGQKLNSKTFNKNSLKYSMEYINDNLIKGYEYNLNEQVVFEYAYDEAGEISKKVEYIYNQDNVLESTKEIVY